MVVLNSLENTLDTPLCNIQAYIDSDLVISTNSTTHKFQSDCPICIQNIINDISLSKNLQQALLSNSGCNTIHCVHQMNEIYSSKSGSLNTFKSGSDAVFETEHIDGPFGLIPFLSLYRVIVTIINETNTITVINKRHHLMLRKQFVLIDYNRDLHYIKSSERDEGTNSNSKRYVLKLHFVTYDKNKVPLFIVNTFTNVNVFYNTVARILFLYSLKPSNWQQTVLAYLINSITFIWARASCFTSHIQCYQFT